MNFLSNLIFGELIKGYTVDQNHFFTAGTQNWWTVCDGKRNKDNQQVSIWILKKGKNSSGKNVTDEIVSFLKQEPQNLLKIRHPSFLSVLEPIHEDAKQVAFVTEKIDSSLYIDLKKNQNDKFEDDLELKQNCKELLEGLKFMHENIKALHLNVSPENILVLPSGKLKWGGLAFLHLLLNDQERVNITNLKDVSGQVFPNLSFVGPSHFRGVECNSDVYSFALVLYSIFSNRLGKPTILPESLETISEAQGFVAQLLGVKKKFLMEVFPPELKSLISAILQGDHSNFLDGLLTCEWFDDPQTKLLNYIPNFLTRSEQEQKDFVVSICLMLPKFSQKTLNSRIIPFLRENTNCGASSYVLSGFIMIIEKKLVDVTEVRLAYKKNRLANLFAIFSIQEYLVSDFVHFIVLH